MSRSRHNSSVLPMRRWQYARWPKIPILFHIQITTPPQQQQWWMNQQEHGGHCGQPWQGNNAQRNGSHTEITCESPHSFILMPLIPIADSKFVWFVIFCHHNSQELQSSYCTNAHQVTTHGSSKQTSWSQSGVIWRWKIILLLAQMLMNPRENMASFSLWELNSRQMTKRMT